MCRLLSLLLLCCYASVLTAETEPPGEHSSHAPSSLLPQWPLPGQTGYINFCAGSNVAQLYAPLGYASYLWYAPTNPPSLVGNTYSLGVLNPVPGSVYTVQLVSANGGTFVVLDTLQYSTVFISGIGSNSSCVGGASGSASVEANGSSIGYTYAWFAPGNPNSIGSSSAIANQPPGVYTVNVSALNCGAAAMTITINPSPATYTVIRPFCGNTAYLYTPAQSTSHQWYYNTNLPVPANLGGTAPGYTASPVSTGMFYRVKYLTIQGCTDSVTMLLSQTPPGNFSVSPVTPACINTNDGAAVISLTPALGGGGSFNASVVSLPGAASFSNFSAPFAPPYTYSFAVNNLSGNSSYGVSAFDGVCSYSATFYVPNFTINYTLSPSSSTLCPGGTAFASAQFSNAALYNQYTYAWSPNQNLSNNGSFSTLISAASLPVGGASVIVYTLTVTPIGYNCPISKTVSVMSINYATPTITAIPVLCQGGPNYTVSVYPPGGTFFMSNFGGMIHPQTGVISTSVLPAGNFLFAYSLLPNSCAANVYATVTVNPKPPVVYSGNLIICKGQTATLTASGAHTYSWSNGQTGILGTFTPSNNTIYSLTGTYTTTGCSATSTLAILVNNNPTLSVSGNTVICNGQLTTLTTLGADSYYLNGTPAGSQVNVSPSASGVYSITGVFALTGCATTKTVSILVNGNPTVNVLPSQPLICAGQSVTLTASGAASYNWNTGANTSAIVVTPGSSTNYTVTGTGANNCSTSSMAFVTVQVCNGLADHAAEAQEIKLYPNPANDWLSIETGAGAATVLVHDATGRLIFSTSLKEASCRLYLGHLEEGLYMFTLQQENRITNYRIIKTNN